jgi:hypothetical protein
MKSRSKTMAMNVKALTARLERAKTIGCRYIPRVRLGEMMSLWGGDFAYGRGTGAVGAVASFYYAGKAIRIRASSRKPSPKSRISSLRRLRTCTAGHRKTRVSSATSPEASSITSRPTTQDRRREVGREDLERMVGR